jgi:hypothetical protein
MPGATWDWANKVPPSICQQQALGKMLMQMGTGPEDREEWIRRKQINKHSILPFLTPG